MGLVLLLIYLPLLPPLVFSVATGEAGAPTLTFSRYVELWRNPVLTSDVTIAFANI